MTEKTNIFKKAIEATVQALAVCAVLGFAGCSISNDIKEIKKDTTEIKISSAVAAEQRKSINIRLVRLEKIHDR